MFGCLTRVLTGDRWVAGVLVGAVGKAFEVLATGRAGGLIRTAMRASDILMDRVWQLENEKFEDTFGYVFARVIDVAGPHEDATALHPEVQRQVANIRTDLDAFSALEISCLIRQGFCIGRKACRSRADLFGTELPDSPPWDPIPPARIPRDAPPAARLDGWNHQPNPSTILARQLQTSASRRIWSTFLSFRDWPSFVYIPLLLLLLLVPYFLVNSYLKSRRVSQLIESISHGSPDFEMMSQLM